PTLAVASRIAKGAASGPRTVAPRSAPRTTRPRTNRVMNSPRPSTANSETPAHAHEEAVVGEVVVRNVRATDEATSGDDQVRTLIEGHGQCDVEDDVVLLAAHAGIDDRVRLVVV